MMFMDRTGLLGILEQFPEERRFLRKAAVRLAVKRGVMREARRRIRAKLHQAILGPTEGEASGAIPGGAAGANDSAGDGDADPPPRKTDWDSMLGKDMEMEASFAPVATDGFDATQRSWPFESKTESFGGGAAPLLSSVSSGSVEELARKVVAV